MKQPDQQAAVHRFSLDPDMGVLLMDSVGSVGLDLSFVSYVFLMEPVADKSMEDQVWRIRYQWGGREEAIGGNSARHSLGSEAWGEVGRNGGSDARRQRVVRRESGHTPTGI